MIVGLISDTHGLMRPEALQVLKGSDLILHAGDIGDPDILKRLNQIAPVKAVRGNNDREPWWRTTPETRNLIIGGRRIFLIHDVSEITFDPAGRGLEVVVFGHSHRPLVERRGGVLYINPGSAGPRRFSLPIAVGKLRIGKRSIKGEIIPIEI